MQTRQYELETDFKLGVESMSMAPPLPLVRYSHGVIVLPHDSFKLAEKLLTLYRHASYTLYCKNFNSMSL